MDGPFSATGGWVLGYAWLPLSTLGLRSALLRSAALHPRSALAAACTTHRGCYRTAAPAPCPATIALACAALVWAFLSLNEALVYPRALLYTLHQYTTIAALVPLTY